MEVNSYQSVHLSVSSMNKTIILSGAAVLMLAAACTGSAQVVLRERAFNLNGTISDDPFGAALPAFGGVFNGVIDTWNGLGTMTYSVSGASTYYLSAFFDHDINKAVNTSFNELGSVHNAPLAGQSWELGDPYNSSIYSDFSASGLTHGDLLSGAGVNGGDDVSMAMAWSFVLSATDSAVVSWMLSDTAPVSGFYLQQHDPDAPANSPADVYLSGTLRINNSGTPGVPDGGSTIALLGLGLAFLQGLRMRLPASRNESTNVFLKDVSS